MKLITGKQQFKTVTAKQAEANPALLPNVGKKRAQVEFPLPCYEADDLPELLDSHSKLLLTCLNNAIADLAKAKFAANGADWTYVPSPESDLSLAALAASFESTSRGRVLTNESAGKLVEWLKRNAQEVIAGIQTADASYSSAQLLSICTVISAFTVYAGKDASILAKVVLRLEQISEAIAGSESLADSFTAEPILAEVFDALVKKFTRADEEEITADAL